MRCERIDEEARRRRKAEEAARNRKLMPNVAALVAEAREALPGFKLTLIYGRDKVTGYEVGSAGALVVQAGHLSPRRVR